MTIGQVTIIDVSLRDGIQNEAVLLPQTLRLKLIDQLLSAGVKSLQVASFVHPAKVPQMEGIEALIARLPQASDVAYSGLVLNTKGLERLCASGLKHVDLSLSCSDAHSRKNAGMSRDEALRQTISMIRAAKAAGLHVRVGLQCVFGCHFIGTVAEREVVVMVRMLSEAGCDALALADSTGQAIPDGIKRMVGAVREVSALPLILHLHDTRGLAVANLVAGYEAGVRAFDASLGGVGGCNFIPGATGNLAIEDTVNIFSRMGVATGINLGLLLPAGLLLEEALGYPLPGKMLQLAKRDKNAVTSGSAEAPMKPVHLEASAWA